MIDRKPTAELDSQFSSDDATPIPWAEVCGRLAQADSYWVAPMRPDGQPHLVPVLAV